MYIFIPHENYCKHVADSCHVWERGSISDESWHHLGGELLICTSEVSKCGRMARTRRNGRRWSINVDYCRVRLWMAFVDYGWLLQWFTMDGVGRQSRKVLFVCQLKISNQSREKGFFIGAASKCAPLLRCLRLVQIHNISPLFREMQSYSIMRIWCVHC